MNTCIITKKSSMKMYDDVCSFFLVSDLDIYHLRSGINTSSTGLSLPFKLYLSYRMGK